MGHEFVLMRNALRATYAALNAERQPAEDDDASFEAFEDVCDGCGFPFEDCACDEDEDE